MFGASNGIFMFNPDSISKSRFVPPIVFSKLVIANQDIVPGDNSVLKVGLDDTKELVLSHKENIFAIQYAALDYTNPLISLKALRNNGPMPTGCAVLLIPTCLKDIIHSRYVQRIVTVSGCPIPGISKLLCYRHFGKRHLLISFM